ncbi:MAG: hypothetical protein ACTSUB_06815 [Candidatus Thorarchaeota archaeon]
MRIDLNGRAIPYPLAVIRGKLKLSGLSDVEAFNLISIVEKKLESIQGIPKSETLLQITEDSLSSLHEDASRNFQILREYEIRRVKKDIPPIILAIEGASATGKSMLAIRMIDNLSATRIISTDTIRQILRTSFSEEVYPELFCHTYQAHQYKQVGPENLPDVVRGYLAQCQVIHPTIHEMVSRISLEGVTALVEGVHIIPGKLKDLKPGVVEIIINPSKDDHRAMFTSKHLAGGLTTVSSSEESRFIEFEATRDIHEFMIDQARETNTQIVELGEYREAEDKICELVIQTIEYIISRK